MTLYIMRPSLRWMLHGASANPRERIPGGMRANQLLRDLVGTLCDIHHVRQFLLALEIQPIVPVVCNATVLPSIVPWPVQLGRVTILNACNNQLYTDLMMSLGKAISTLPH